MKKQGEIPDFLPAVLVRIEENAKVLPAVSIRRTENPEVWLAVSIRRAENLEVWPSVRVRIRKSKQFLFELIIDQYGKNESKNSERILR